MANPLGISDEEIDKIIGGLTPIGQVLQDFGNEMQEKLRQSIQSKQLMDSFELWQDINFSTTILGQTFRFTLKMADYYDYVNKGVKGVGGTDARNRPYIVKAPNSPYFYKDKKPNVNDLRGWANRKGLNVWALQTSIYHKGTKETNFYDDVVTQERLDQLTADISKAAGKEVLLSLGKSFRDLEGHGNNN